MLRNNYSKRLPLKKNNNLKKNVRPKWRLGWTYVLSRKKNYLQRWIGTSGNLFVLFGWSNYFGFGCTTLI